MGSEQEKVKPCPWCGEVPRVYVSDIWWYIRCDNAVCAINPILDEGHPQESEAICRWNTRHGEGGEDEY